MSGKNVNISRKKRAFNMKLKAFFFNFKGFFKVNKLLWKVRVGLQKDFAKFLMEKPSLFQGILSKFL